MNRREFLSQIPAYAAVPALLSLPVVQARTRVVAPWLLELECKVSAINWGDYKDRLPRPSFRIPVPKELALRWWELGGRVNSGRVGAAVPGSIQIIGASITEDAYLLFHAREISWNLWYRDTSLHPGALFLVRDAHGNPVHPEIDFYSL